MERQSAQYPYWNVSGIRAFVKKNGFDYITQEDPDIIALQEVKCNYTKLPDEAKPEGYLHYYMKGARKGYCGVALLSKVKPINIIHGLQNKMLEDEARVIRAEFETFFVVNVYAPNSGDKLTNLPKRLEWNDMFKGFVNKLGERKTVIICGDLNVAHKEIDLAEPRKNIEIAGFTQQETDGITELLKEGFVDFFRFLYPQKTNSYTFWSYANDHWERNIGWRLDYFLVSERVKVMIIDSIIKSDVYGSDHCPIMLLVHLNKLKLDSKIPIQTFKTYADVTTVIHQWKDPLTYRRDNYAHFISEDCEPSNNIAKLLIATDRLDI